MLLYLVRHGIAIERDNPKCPPEPERFLTAEGVKKSRAAALGLKAIGVKPDVFLTSPYVRAAQTAEIFAEALGFTAEKIRASDALKPGGNPALAVQEISKIRAKELICFGHAPHLDQLIAQVTGARGVFTELKKAGVACLEHAAAQNRWMLRWLFTPKMLRQLAK
jgi:phosphohistidine phosphatase